MGEGVAFRIRRSPVQILLGAMSGFAAKPRYEPSGDLQVEIKTQKRSN